jgi:hypothetical protein
MPCKVIKIGESVGVICGPKVRDNLVCKFCGAMAVRICDFPMRFAGGKRRTCDAPICEAHQTKIGPESDLCPDHAREWAA